MLLDMLQFCLTKFLVLFLNVDSRTEFLTLK